MGGNISGFDAALAIHQIFPLIISSDIANADSLRCCPSILISQ